MNIKKIITSAIAVSLSVVAFAGCNSTNASEKTQGNSKSETSNNKTIVIGTTSTPHGEILEHIKPVLEEQGWTLDIKIYDDYVLPNKALTDGELDANYFQHTPYLNSYNSENGTDLASAAEIHYEPFGLYGNGVSSLDDVKEGASIVIPADDSNETRALLLLQQEGLIKLPDDASAEKGVTTLDIVDDGGYKITTVQADTVAAQFGNSDEGSLAVINGNYALAAGLDIKNALAVENADGDAAHTYANIIAVRAGDENSEKTKAIIDALKTDDVKQFIESEYDGAVVAIF
ncbi:MetQ/NlpA family ABC transporter substrate-binding protein [Ruminococcus albus]|uniref:Lipoprotein n=1 Tax=Ruminococcus albus TaxID=1264 RepID=A0A1I1JGQ9_RUMAL|nr:D-methionine transport system substrate-binding protein [Ruminococcus albus]